MFSDLLKSKLFIVFGAAVVLILAISLGREMYRKYLIESEIRQLQGEVDKMNRSNADLSALIGYFNSPEYKERQAREQLGLQKPGEFAVALPPEAGQPSAKQTGQASGQAASNLEKWWQYFFGHK